MRRGSLLIILLLGTLGLRAQANFDYFYLEAEKCRLQEDFSSAMDLYRHCLDINPEAPEALYSEMIPGGYVSVTPNPNHYDSKISIEVLFNTVMKNKETIKQIFG